MTTQTTHSPFSAQLFIPIRPNPIENILAFDLEWSLTKDEYGEFPITAAGFYADHGLNRVFLIEDFKEEKISERSLLSKIIEILAKYDYSVGFYSTGARVFNPIRHRLMGRDSDLIQLHKRLERFSLPSPIYINDTNHLPYLVGEKKNHTHLDAYNLFTNKVIKSAIYGNSYNSNDLDTISRAILGNEGGKYSGISGPIFESLTDLDEKRMYVFQDAKLLLDCVAHNNYELLKVMHSLSELTGIPFKNICNAKGVTKIWTPVLDKLVKEKLLQMDGVNGTDAEVLQYDILGEYYDRKKGNFTAGLDLEIELPTKSNARYIGGWVMSTVPGEYKNVSVFDITSLYPAMIVNNNISFETVNCNCCKRLRSAKVPKYLFEDEKSNNCHICIKNKGILTNQIENYMRKRIDHKMRSKEMQLIDPIKAREHEIISNSYKILINSVYGQMGHKFAKYENVLAAELVTRFGRWTIQECAKIAREIFNWNIIYGDTDSLFVDSKIMPEEVEKFFNLCKERLNVSMELDKRYDKFLISGAKNYVGISGSNLIVKGLAGKKSDRCPWVRKCFKQMLEDYKNNVNPCVNLRSQLIKLQSGKLEDKANQLIIFKQLNKGVSDYKINVVQKLIGQIKNLEEGDTVRYYMSEGDAKYTEDINKASIKEYKKQLINTVMPILKLLNYDIKKELDISSNITNNKLTKETEELPIDDKYPVVSLKEKPKNVTLNARSASKIIQLN
jgi:DNA polymerase elongation subunit (family B)